MVPIDEGSTDDEMTRLSREMSIHGSLVHEHIIHLKDALLFGLDNTDNVAPGAYLLMEYAEGGDLFTRLRNGTTVFRLCLVVTDVPVCLVSRRGVGIRRARRYFRQIVEALVSAFHVRGCNITESSRCTCMAWVSAIWTSNQRTYCLMEPVMLSYAI